MKKTSAIEPLLVLAIFALSDCGAEGRAVQQEQRQQCAALAIAKAVGTAVTTGDARLLRQSVVDSRDLAWFQDAPGIKRNPTFDAKAYKQVTDDVAAWSSICKGGEVTSIALGNIRRSQEVEGFARRLDVIQDSIVHVLVRGKDVPVRVQYLWSSDGCWRLIELGKPQT